jgi:23S rRNA (uracil-5-)-methyltransferase RumA
MRAPVPVTMHRLGVDGLGEGTDERGRTWHLRGAVPGSTVWGVGRPKSGFVSGVVSPAAAAVTPPCPNFGPCGGCQWQAMALGEQRDAKLDMVRRILAGLGGRDHGVEGAPAAYGYRDKLEVTFGPNRWTVADEPREGVWAGMHAAGRFDRIVDCARCELATDGINAVWARARADLLQFAPYDAKSHVGFVRHLVLRQGDDGVLAALYTATGDQEAATRLRALARTWGAAGVLWYEGDERADAARGRLREVLCGVDQLRVTLGGRAFRLSPTAFFQVNRPGMELVLARVRQWVAPGPLLDLCCGVGTFANILGGRPAIGVDLDAAAIDDARNNASDAAFHAGALEDVLPALSLPARPSLVVDPPRGGLHPRALAFIAGLDAAVLVYVSCRPSSLARDGRVLMERGWRCTDRVAVDLFPQTSHVEVVSRWERQAGHGTSAPGQPGNAFAS